MEQDNNRPIAAVLDEAVEETDGDEVTFGELLDVFNSRSYGPLLLIPALIALFPLIGGIPGMSIFTGTLILLIAIQMPFVRHPWVPGRIQRVSFRRDKLTKFSESFKRWTRWIDKIVAPRLTVLTGPPFLYVIALACLVLAVSFYPLALVPFGVAAPAAAITLFAIGLTARDGLCILLGFVLVGVATWLTIIWWPF